MKATNKLACNICNMETHGEYCHKCGQKITNKRLHISNVVEDFLSNLFSLEKSGLATMLSIIKDPMPVIKSYWDGFRRYHESPSKFVVYASLVIGAHVIAGNNLILGLAFSDDPQWFFIIVMLVLLTISSFLTYFKQRHSLLEHLVANIYLLTTWIIITILFYEIIYYFIGQNLAVSLGLLFGLIGLVLIYSARVMSKTKTWKSMIANVFLQLLVMTLLFASILMVGIVFGELELRFD